MCTSVDQHGMGGVRGAKIGVLHESGSTARDSASIVSVAGDVEA